MANKTTDRKRHIFTNSVERALWDEILIISNNTQVAKTRLIDKAFSLLIEHYRKNGESIDFSERME